LWGGKPSKEKKGRKFWLFKARLEENLDWNSLKKHHTRHPSCNFAGGKGGKKGKKKSRWVIGKL
jgi:hypothetical protein